MADRGLLSGGLAALLEGAQLRVPDDLPVLVAEHAKSLDAADAALYVVDYEQLVLVPVPNPAGPAREEALIDTTLAGRCYRTIESSWSPTSTRSATSAGPRESAMSSYRAT